MYSTLIDLFYHLWETKLVVFYSTFKSMLACCFKSDECMNRMVLFKKTPFLQWTFYRFLGIQEPASFLFSLMNFLSNLIGWIKYSKLKTDPYYNVWKIHTLITLHAWLWSTVFHARETSFAEVSV